MIIDCFTFFNELDLLEIRLRELAGVVDRFVLAEATLTFQGKPKPLYFGENASRFERFRDKIEHVVVNLPETNDPWVREGYQRDALKRGIDKLPSNAMVFVSDADEIFSPSAMNEAASRRQFTFVEMDLFYYFLNLKSEENKWVKAYCAPAGEIMSMADLTLPRWREREYLRERDLPSDAIIRSGGWHFSWLGGLPQIMTKIDSFSHAEIRFWLDRQKEIATDLASGRRFFVDGQKLQKVKRTDLPISIQQNYRQLERAGYFWKPLPWYRKCWTNLQGS